MVTILKKIVCAINKIKYYGDVLKNTTVKLKIKGKIHKFITNEKGIVKIKSNFKIGKNKIIAYNPISREKSKIPVIILKKGTHKKNIKIDVPTYFHPTEKLKNGDYIETIYQAKYKKHKAKIYIICSTGDYEKAKHTKVLKAKIFFKDKKTGKVKTKITHKIRNNCINTNSIKGYKPFKATVYYKDINN